MSDPRFDHVLCILLQPGLADPNSPEGSRIYASAATVLANLTNPLNVSLLSTQILMSPAIWHCQDGLQSAQRTLGVFRSATLGKIECPGLSLGVEDWLNALIRGANQNGKVWWHISGANANCWNLCVQCRVGNIFYCSVLFFQRTMRGHTYLESLGRVLRRHFVGQ